jgi:hypothetical protein
MPAPVNDNEHTKKAQLKLAVPFALKVELF